MARPANHTYGMYDLLNGNTERSQSSSVREQTQGVRTHGCDVAVRDRTKVPRSLRSLQDSHCVVDVADGLMGK